MTTEFTIIEHTDREMNDYHDRFYYQNQVEDFLKDLTQTLNHNDLNSIRIVVGTVPKEVE